MAHRVFPSGTVHTPPSDLRKALLSSKKALAMWEAITPLARNEWVCWVESVKKTETRREHIFRTVEELTKGKRRPCCWIGCVHRKDKPMSSSQKYMLSRKSKRV